MNAKKVQQNASSQTCLQAHTANHEKVDVLLCLDVPSNDATHRMSQGQIYMSEIESGTVSKKDLVTSNDNIINMSSSMVSKEIKNPPAQSNSPRETTENTICQ